MVKKKDNKKTKDVKLRQIPTKNYIIVAIIFVVAIFLAFFLRNWYLSYQDYARKVPILNGVISEIHYNEIYNYISENQSGIIYMGVADDEDCRQLEVDLKNLIQKEHLKNKIIYFNITDVSDKDLLLKEFNDKYATNDRVPAYPAIILFDEGKIIDFKSKNANNNLLISDIEQILDEYEVQGD